MEVCQNFWKGSIIQIQKLAITIIDQFLFRITNDKMIKIWNETFKYSFLHVELQHHWNILGDGMVSAPDQNVPGSNLMYVSDWALEPNLVTRLKYCKGSIWLPDANFFWIIPYNDHFNNFILQLISFFWFAFTWNMKVFS